MHEVVWQDDTLEKDTLEHGAIHMVTDGARSGFDPVDVGLELRSLCVQYLQLYAGHGDRITAHDSPTVIASETVAV